MRLQLFLKQVVLLPLREMVVTIEEKIILQ